MGSASFVNMAMCRDSAGDVAHPPTSTKPDQAIIEAAVNQNAPEAQQPFLETRIAPMLAQKLVDPAQSRAPALQVAIPDATFARFLADRSSGIAVRSGASLRAHSSENGSVRTVPSVLEISGSPTQIAVACYLVQVHGWLRASHG